jgi:hypothetical protein
MVAQNAYSLREEVLNIRLENSGTRGFDNFRVTSVLLCIWRFGRFHFYVFMYLSICVFVYLEIWECSNADVFMTYLC